jgi:hemolysin activation/secretion protein
VQDRFATTRNRDQIEKTEDYSLGWKLRAQVGFASSAAGSDRNAIMVEGKAATGYDLTDRQSLTLSAHASGRFEDGNLANGLIGAEARYYFRHSQRRLFFMGLATTAGTDLDTDTQVLLGGDNGLRGYPLRYQAGTGRWLFTAEQRMYSNWFPFQLFNVGGAVFFDMGRVMGRDPLGSQPQGVLKDVGIGLRLGNSRSALGNVLHIDLAFPLDGDSSIDSMQVVVETKRSF